jgi:hypothetical protein
LARIFASAHKKPQTEIGRNNFAMTDARNERLSHPSKDPALRGIFTSISWALFLALLRQIIEKMANILAAQRELIQLVGSFRAGQI